MAIICPSILVVITLLWVNPALSEIIYQDDFDGYSDSITGWATASNVSLKQSGGIRDSKCAHVRYTGPGTALYWFSHNIADKNLSEIYVRFYFKVDDPSGGCKFLKLFGRSNNPVGYANTTWAINYTSGNLYEISYGDGTVTSNDTQAVIRYSGSYTDPNVNIVSSSDQFDPRDGQWHCFEAHMKYNANGERNGVYRVWIDGALRIHAINVRNRNDQNSMFLKSVDLANYCSDRFDHEWNLWYDNVVIATEYIGPLLSAPTGIRIRGIQ